MSKVIDNLFDLTPLEDKNSRLSFTNRVKEEIESYLNNNEWRSKENANKVETSYGLRSHLAQLAVAEYSLNELPFKYAYGHRTAWWHIHDLGSAGIFDKYCSGLNLEALIMEGFKDGISNSACSKPAKHFESILNHMVNFFTVMAHEAAGAVAFSSIDLYLAPFIRQDSLYFSKMLNMDVDSETFKIFMRKKIKQSLQNFVWYLNYPLRGGSESLFTNVSLDLDVQTSDMKDRNCFFGGTFLDYTYGDLQEEVDLFNECMLEVMLEGQPNGLPFSFPLVTINITPSFRTRISKKVQELIAKCSTKIGLFYFQNCVSGFLGNTKIDSGSVRSMCCRLHLDKKEIMSRTGGLFGSGVNTGSICVTTLNLPRLGYVAKIMSENSSEIKDCFYEILSDSIDITIKGMLKRKERILENIFQKKLEPFTVAYEREGLPTYFITLGYTGLHECLVNLGYKDGLNSTENIDVAKEIMQFMLDKVLEYQEKTGSLINMEATPAEGAAARFCKADKNYFDDIYFVDKENVFYTNSCLPSIEKQDDFEHFTNICENLLPLNTGGCVAHYYLSEVLDEQSFWGFIETICYKTKIPYFTLTKIINYCPSCKRVVSDIDEKLNTCKICGSKVDVLARVIGYYRSVSRWNFAKSNEWNKRKSINIPKKEREVIDVNFEGRRSMSVFA